MEKIRQRSNVAETWRGILGHFEESGMAVPAFCARERISRQSLYRFLRQILYNFTFTGHGE
jgi:hypothetical protein